MRDLPAVSPDPALSQLDTPYLVVTKDAIPLYASMEDTTAAQTLASGMKYLAIQQRVDNDSGVFYQLKTGWWVKAGEAGASCCIYAGRFQGLTFKQNPTNSFGWIIETAISRTGPGYAFPETSHSMNRETVVQIYGTQEADKTTWYRINLTEWVERRYIRQLVLHTTPPAGVNNGRWIEVNLYEQTLSVYENGNLVFATLIASGMDPFFTRPGLFQIYKKKPLETMSGAFEADKSDFYYLEDVPWTMYYDEARALHGAYWRAMFGYPQSHGCVNLSPGDSHWLYDWANEGDWVYIWDPSGQTPADPKFYGPGGA
ncbi:MAG TPA: L,D-transpeptidase [Anaerolineaceae bacterium]|nr:L,D-transpeptidase [Anaerolineaceae bacterium]HPN52423.1 L,D-transpeptidase [Anaerolineaceae bacterium]